MRKVEAQVLWLKANRGPRIQKETLQCIVGTRFMSGSTSDRQQSRQSSPADSMKMEEAVVRKMLSTISESDDDEVSPRQPQNVRYLCL